MFILIGGNGFLGRHLRDALNARGESVAIVTRRAGLANYPAERFYAAEDFSEALRACDAPPKIVYLASTSVPGTQSGSAWGEIEANVKNAIRYAEDICAHAPESRLIYISSGGTVYGNAAGRAAAAETTPLAPVSLYGLGKVCSEQALAFLSRTRGLRTTVLRVANPVGRHQCSNLQGIVPALFRSLTEHRPFTVFGSGKNVRDYLDADDVADAILTAADSDDVFDVYNVGSGVGRSVLEMVGLAERAASRSVRIEYVPPRPVDVDGIVLDCAKIACDLNWRPKRDLTETIAEMWPLWRDRQASSG